MEDHQRLEKEDILLIRFEWKISNLLEIPEYGEVDSSEFVLLNKFKICLTVDSLSKTCYRVWMHLLSDISSSTFIRYELCIIDEHGKERFPMNKTAKFDEFVKVEHIITLNAEKLKDDILQDNALTFRCTLSVGGDSDAHDGTAEAKVILLPESGSSKLLETLSSDLLKFYENKADTDFVLKVDKGQFPVHRAVLAARSEVFAAMFRHGTSESDSGETNIQDVSADTMTNVLHYIYSGKIRGLTSDSAVSIFIAADKYALLKLRQDCLNFLSQNLTVENVCGAARLAYTHAEDTLENHVVDFIRDNMQNILATEEWMTLVTEKPRLANKLLSTVCLASKIIKRNVKNSSKK